MCEFRVGDEVVCVDASDHSWLPGGLPMEGLCLDALYTIKDVGPRHPDGQITVWLHETGNFTPHGRDDGYAPFRFRKVQRRDLTAWLATENTIEGPTRETVKEGVK